MGKGEIEFAVRQALNEFDKWNDATGVIPKFCGYYYEAQACIEDAVHIGIQVALFKQVFRSDDGNILKSEPDGASIPKPEDEK